MVTIKDVAREAGVSIATASRAINGVTTVDPRLALKVRSAAETLGYRRNGVARSLRRRRTNAIALIISDIGNPFFTAVARGVEDVAQRAGYSVLLGNSDEDAEKEARYLDIAEQSLVAGVLLSPNAAHSELSRLQSSGTPVVVIDRALEEPIDSVLVDSSEGARSATTHLLDSGWSNPGCITGPEGSDTAVRRARGYREAMREHRVNGAGEQVVHTDYRPTGGRAAAARLLDLPAPVDALFVANLEMAIGVLEELRSRDLRPGRDIGLVAFDDASWTTFLDPPLTVVAQPAYEIGVEAATLLLDRIDESIAQPAGSATVRPSRTVVLRTRLIPRESSARPGTL